MHKIGHFIDKCQEINKKRPPKTTAFIYSQIIFFDFT